MITQILVIVVIFMSCSEKETTVSIFEIQSVTHTDYNQECD
jgi:hypothetical protein